MRTSTLVIGLFRDRLEVAHCRRGKVVAAHARPISLGGAIDAEAWVGEVRSLGDALRSALHELNVDALRNCAIVVYESPSAVADCYSIPAGSTGEARQAAMLSAADSIPQTAQNLTTGTVFIGRDDGEAPLRSSGTSQPNHADGSTNRSGRSHVIAAAEREDIILAIFSMLGRANVELIGAAPVPAVIAATALKRSADHAAHCRRRATTSPAAAPLLHIAESGSFLVIRDTGRSQRGAIRFTRPISIGITALANALMRSMESRPGSGLDLAAARTALAEFGLPQDPDARHESTGLTARDVLPSLQPLVQRLVIELRQSLRFALEQSERDRMTLVLTGPGGEIPGLEKALERELGVQIIANEPSRKYDAAKVGSCGSELCDAAATYFRRGSYAIDDLFLKPPGAALQQTTVRIKQALWTGAAAALFLIAIDAVRLHDRIAQAQNTNHSIQPAMHAGAAQLGALAGEDPIRLLSLLDATAQFRAEIERETSRGVDIRSCMQELSALTPSAIRFNTLSFQTARGDEGDAAGRSSMDLTITGIARSDEAAQPRTLLDHFVRQLRASELFSRVELKNVQIAARSADARADQHFEILLSAAPSLRNTRAIAAIAGTASPAHTASATSEDVQ